MSFDKYLKTIKSDYRHAIKVEWLNADESVKFEFTNSLYDINVNLNVNYQNGSRRSCTITINNDKNKFPIDFNNIWIGQKFKLWLGIYIDEKTPYYFPQGVFYISNPSETYNPNTRTVTINGVDKWAYLDGTLFGNLTGTYQTNIDNNLFDAIRALLCLSRYKSDYSHTDILDEMIDPIPPLLSSYYMTKTTVVNGFDKSVLECPYTATVERGGTFADVILEYATILCAHVYYDVNGRFVLEPMIDTADDITDTNKEILWNYTVDEKTFLGLTQTFNFDKVYNDFIVLGNITNGYQFKGRVQNRNPMSNTCVQRIGLKSKPPYEDNQYVSNQQCVELAKYYAKTDTILQKSGTINSITLYHLDVNKLVTVSTPNNNMSKELFLISGFTLSTSGSMNINITSVNILRDFSTIQDIVLIDGAKSEYLDFAKATEWYANSGTVSFNNNYLNIDVRTGGNGGGINRTAFIYTIPLLKELPDLFCYNYLNIEFDSSNGYLNDQQNTSYDSSSTLSINISGVPLTIKSVSGKTKLSLSGLKYSIDISNEFKGDLTSNNVVISISRSITGISNYGYDLIKIKKMWLSES